MVDTEGTEGIGTDLHGLRKGFRRLCKGGKRVLAGDCGGNGGSFAFAREKSFCANVGGDSDVSRRWNIFSTGSYGKGRGDGLGYAVVKLRTGVLYHGLAGNDRPNVRVLHLTTEDTEYIEDTEVVPSK